MTYKQLKIFDALVNSERFMELYSKISFWMAWFLDKSNKEQKYLLAKIHPYTFCSYKRLKNIWMLAEMIEKNKTKGAFVECGVWKGGCAAIMVYIAQKYNSKRKIYLFDSFEGLPEPTQKDGKRAIFYSNGKSQGKLKSIKKAIGKLAEVQHILFSTLKLKRKYVYFYKGWFQFTIPKYKNKVRQIAILRLDADWYESTKTCLNEFYNQVIPGGFVILDDYENWPGSKRALDEFFKKRKISPKVIKIDSAGIYFKKDLKNSLTNFSSDS
jgi:O-methyltransferase